jgi:hypothetical protein
MVKPGDDLGKPRDEVAKAENLAQPLPWLWLSASAILLPKKDLSMSTQHGIFFRHCNPQSRVCAFGNVRRQNLGRFSAAYAPPTKKRTSGAKW